MNEVLSSGLAGCQSGLGIFVQSGNSGSSTVNVNNNHVENYQKNGITGNEAGTNITVANNTVIGQGPTTGAAENSVQIGFGAISERSVTSPGLGGQMNLGWIAGQTMILSEATHSRNSNERLRETFSNVNT